MTIAQEIIGYAHTLFDVAGATQIPDGTQLLIVGLESTPEHDLDEFQSIGGKFHLTGFEKHARHKLESLLTFIRKKDFSAELVGRCGYPLKGEIRLKEAAVRAGLGRWGKNTIVIHTKYGNRLRFMAIKTDAPMEPAADFPDMREESPICSGCTICIDACPEKVLEPYRMPETGHCLANVANMVNKNGRLIACDICLRLCPASNQS